MLLFGVLYLFDRHGSLYQVRILNNMAIFITLAVSYNLVNGICGQLHLGPNAFITIGAYTSALLTMSPAEKQMSFIIEPLDLAVHRAAGSVSRLPAGGRRGGRDLCLPDQFSGISGARRLPGHRDPGVWRGGPRALQCVQSLTNGPLGLKGLLPYTNLWWSWGVAVFTIIVTTKLVNSSYGRAMKAIREDEMAAKAMGVDPFRHLLLAFLVSAFFSGVAGGLLAHLITTISPTLFTFFLTFNLLIIIVVGRSGQHHRGGARSDALRLGRRSAAGGGKPDESRICSPFREFRGCAW